jgi:hypothetical protein
MGKDKSGGDVVMADASAPEIFSVPSEWAAQRWGTGTLETDAMCVCMFGRLVLETVKAAQLQNGLRHRDFQRYRQYCARRLRRIRKSTKFTHGKGKAFLNKKVDVETASEVRYVHLPTERLRRRLTNGMMRGLLVYCTSRCTMPSARGALRCSSRRTTTWKRWSTATRPTRASSST